MNIRFLNKIIAVCVTVLPLPCVMRAGQEVLQTLYLVFLLFNTQSLRILLF